MGFPNKPAGAVEIVPSMEFVEFVVDDNIYRAEYDSSRGQPSLAVVAVIAVANQRAPCDLTPLYSVIDTDALDDLFATTATEGQRSGCLSFSYEGFEVTVFSEGVIEAKPRANV